MNPPTSSANHGRPAPPDASASSKYPEPRWRVGHQGRDMMYYEEKRGGTWQRLDLDGEMLTGRAHHVIYFRSSQDWQRYPDWARNRREEIIARVQREFREPDYEYEGAAPDGHSPAANRSPAAVRYPANPPAGSVRPARQGMRALAVAVALLLSLAGGMAFLVIDGIRKGETWYPTKKTSQRRMVARAGEPALYWVAIGLYSGIGTGSLGLAVWGVREGCRVS